MRTIMIVLIMTKSLSAQLTVNTAKQTSSEFQQSQEQVAVYYQGKSDGAIASRQTYDGSGWWIGGIASAIIPGSLLIMYSSAASGAVLVPESYEFDLRRKSALYQIAFREAYSQTSKDRRKSYVAVGATVGMTDLATVIYFKYIRD